MTHTPSEELLADILAGRAEDVVPHLTNADLADIERTRLCPRDGRALADGDNPRHPGLNRELSCSCGFALTT